MNVYVAGKTQDISTVRTVQGLVRSTGHRVTHDWTKIVEKHGGDANEVSIDQETRTQYALWDMQGVLNCDVLIAVGHPNLCGTFWECGAGALAGKQIWLVLWERCSRHSIFEDLPMVTKMSLQQAGQQLWEHNFGVREDPQSGLGDRGFVS